MAQGLAQTAFEAGELASKEQRWQAALRYYERALQDRQSFPEAWAGKADALAQLGETSSARRAIEKVYWSAEACALAPAKDEKLKQQLSAFESALRKKDLEFADSTLKLALRMAPTSPLVAYAEGRLCLGHGKYTAAVECFELAILLAESAEQKDALLFHLRYAQLTAGRLSMVEDAKPPLSTDECAWLIKRVHQTLIVLGG